MIKQVEPYENDDDRKFESSLPMIEKAREFIKKIKECSRSGLTDKSNIEA